MAKTVHVYPTKKGWAVKREGLKESGVYTTQKEAIQRARSISRGAAPSQMVVHGRDGSIREHVTHGLPRVQDPPGKSASAYKIQKAVGKFALERLAEPIPRRG